MSIVNPTYVGQIAAVTGAVLRVRLRDDMPAPLLMIRGESYRVGQIGSFFRIPLGYASLYAVCTQIGADAAPVSIIPEVSSSPLDTEGYFRLSGFRLDDVGSVR